MLKFVKSLLLLGIVFLFCSFAVSRLFDRFIMSNSIVLKNDRYFYDLGEPVHFVFFGDSHTKNALNPDQIPGTFNFASTKECYIQTFYKLKHILENSAQGENITHVFIPYDLSSFATFRIDNIQPTSYWAKYVNFWELGQVTGKPLKYLMRYVEAYLFSYYNNGAFLFEYVGWKFFKGGQVVQQLNGFTPKDGDFSKIYDPYEYTMDKLHKLFKESVAFDPVLVHYFKETINLCLEYQKEIILLKFPMAREHIDGVSEIYPNYYQDLQMVENIVNRPGVHVFDYREHFEKERHLFHDQAHLNRKGAVKFGDLMKQRLQEIGAPLQ